jgi:hypothetical protein
MVANVKAQQCTQSPLWMRCLYVSVHELCAACAISSPHFLSACTDHCFLPCLLSFFYSNFFASLSSFIHLSFPPRLDCVSNLRLSISHISVSLFLVHIASLIHSFDRFHPCEVGLLCGVVSMDCNVNDGKVSSSSSSSS